MRRIGVLFLVLTGLLTLGVLVYRMGWFQFSYPSATRFPVRGIDVSHHQGAIDWSALSKHGVSFAFVKSTEGATFIDPRFVLNWQAALAYGIPWAPYHFFTFCTPGAAQAAHFKAVAAQAVRLLPPVVDIEFAGNCSSWSNLQSVRNELAEFLSLVEQDFGERPVLYVTRSAQKRVLGGHFTSYPRWPRSLFSEPATSEFGAWSFWQYADNARLPGISGPVDLDVYCCSRVQFQSLSAPRTTSLVD